MLRLPFILSLLLLLGSCGFFRSPGKERCQRLLPRDQITDILTDMYLLEGFLSERQNYHPQTRDSVDYYYAAIFDSHGISHADFRQALDCYLLHPDEMLAIHDEILNRLTIQMTEADAELEQFLQRQQQMQQADSLLTDSLEMDFMRR
ncbi:MAG: DUF4296 domain-containing protein [Bacteroidales bacterium]|nr:DUF4296 domain-containing protein [Bacteroidales bacterium]